MSDVRDAQVWVLRETAQQIRASKAKSKDQAGADVANALYRQVAGWVDAKADEIERGGFVSDELRVLRAENKLLRVLHEGQADALSVLRDLVALRDGPILALNSARRPIRAEAFETAWARARALVAEHTEDGADDV